MEHFAMCLICHELRMIGRFVFITETGWGISVGLCKRCCNEHFGKIEKYER